MKRLALRALIVSVVLNALLGIYAILVGDMGEMEVRILLTALTVTAASILALACGAALDQRSFGDLPKAGAALALLAGGATIVLIWIEAEKETAWKPVASAALFATAIALSSLLSLARPAERHRWVQKGAYATAATLAALLTAWMWAEWDGDVIWRVVGVLSILLAAATVAVPVLHRLARGERARPLVVRFCPACGGALEAETDAATCQACGARFRIVPLSRA